MQNNYETDHESPQSEASNVTRTHSNRQREVENMFRFTAACHHVLNCNYLSTFEVFSILCHKKNLILTDRSSMN